MKKRFIILAPIFITALVFIDQTIKILITNYFLDGQICKECVCADVQWIIVADFILFKPVLNTGYMGPLVNFAALFGIDISGYSFSVLHKTVVILFSVGIFLVFSRYLIYVQKKYMKLIYIFLVFWLAGVVCSLIDTVFWGGSLDYIMLRFFPYIFDLKDVYLTCSPILLIPWLISYYRYYYKLSKEERKKEDNEISLIKWLKKAVLSVGANSLRLRRKYK